MVERRFTLQITVFERLEVNSKNRMVLYHMPDDDRALAMPEFPAQNVDLQLEEVINRFHPLGVPSPILYLPFSTSQAILWFAE